jgi:hypothetical protein
MHIKRRSVPTSQETHNISPTKDNQVMPLREIIAAIIYVGKNAEVFFFIFN